MSDYRNEFRNPDDPFRNDSNLDPNVRTPSAAWGWIAAAVFLVIVLAVAFGAGHQGGQSGTNMASNTMAPPSTSRPSPSTVLPPTATPTPAPSTTTPIKPAPSNPAGSSSGQ